MQFSSNWPSGFWKEDFLKILTKKNYKKAKHFWTKTIWRSMVGTQPRHIFNKFEVNLADGFGEEVNNVNNANTIDFAIPIELHSNQYAHTM